MIILRETRSDSMDVLRDLYRKASDDKFCGYGKPDEADKIMFIANMIKNDFNQFFIGKINTLCSNLTMYWLYEHQGYDEFDALQMSIRRCERGWESYVNNMEMFSYFSRNDKELNPWNKRQRLFTFGDLYGINFHRVHTHKNVAIVSFIFSDGYNEFQSRQCIVKKHWGGKYYITQDVHSHFDVRNNDFNILYPQFNLI